MTEELRQTMLDHLLRIESTIRELHRQAHTGIIRLDSGSSSDAVSRIEELRRIIREFK